MSAALAGRAPARIHVGSIDRDPAIANVQWRRIIADCAPRAPLALQVVAPRMLACRTLKWHALHVFADAVHETGELLKQKAGQVEAGDHAFILAELLEQQLRRRDRW